MDVSGDGDGEVEQGTGFGVEGSLAVIALDVLGERRVLRESTEILPVGLRSIEAAHGR